MIYSNQVLVKRWIPILEEYEKVKAKVKPRSFKFVKDLCGAYHISRKELNRYYRKWIKAGRSTEALFPKRRGARPGSRRTPRYIERNLVSHPSIPTLGADRATKRFHQTGGSGQPKAETSPESLLLCLSLSI